MALNLQRVQAKDLPEYKADMQEAFRLGAIESGFPEDTGEILPESDIDRSLSEKGAVAYKAVLDGRMVGGAILVINAQNRNGRLDFLYVKHGVQGLGIGKFMWFEIERLHPEIQIWETCTPYFEKRNLHFYINVCRFHVVDYWNDQHEDPHSPFGEPEDEEDSDVGMFGFRKEIR